jgi:hypothetical protein
MTTILLTIVGILLAAISALMVFWYGGDAFDRGRAEAIAGTQISHVSQLAHAIRFYELQEERDDLPKNDGAVVQSLVAARYLAGDIKDASGKGVAYWYSPTSPGHRHVLIGNQDADVCRRINRRVGVDVTPKAVDLTTISGELGCVDLGGGNNVVFFQV